MLWSMVRHTAVLGRRATWTASHWNASAKTDLFVPKCKLRLNSCCISSCCKRCHERYRFVIFLYSSLRCKSGLDRCWWTLNTSEMSTENVSGGPHCAARSGCLVAIEKDFAVKLWQEWIGGGWIHEHKYHVTITRMYIYYSNINLE